MRLDCRVEALSGNVGVGARVKWAGDSGTGYNDGCYVTRVASSNT